MELQEFDKLLASHDWYYSYSDDINVYRRGQTQYEKLVQEAKVSDKHQQLFDVWQKHQGTTQNKLSRPELDDERIRLGVTTRAQMQAEEAELQACSLRQQVESEQRELKRLNEFDELCAQHDWFYWKNEIESRAYKEGLDQRRLITTQRHYSEKYRQLFEAHAAYNNGPSVQGHAAILELGRKFGLRA